MNPKKQIETFLGWFNDLGVTSFDIHIRKPDTPGEDYKLGNWKWLTQNEKITADYILKTLLPWIRYENAHGSDIYFRPHKNENYAVVFLDDVSMSNAMKIAKKYTACIVETSQKNTQIWLGINRSCDTFERKMIQISLKNKGFSDPGSISGDHLGRLCGVKSQKHNTWVNLVTISRVQPYIPDYDNENTIPISPLNLCKKKIYTKNNNLGIAPQLTNNGGECASFKSESFDSSQSGKEFGWVLGMLRKGYDYNTVADKLYAVANKRNKKSPEIYVKRTLNNARKLLEK
jgi:hypothetical protein